MQEHSPLDARQVPRLLQGRATLHQPFSKFRSSGRNPDTLVSEWKLPNFSSWKGLFGPFDSNIWPLTIFR
eukprot:s2369_g2.t1